MLCIHAVTDENGQPIEDEEESGRRLCEYWVTSLSLVLRVNGTIAMRPFSGMFRRLLTNDEKESAAGPDGIPYSIYRCAGGFGSQFLFNAYMRVLEG